MSGTRVNKIICPASRQRMSHAETKSYIQRGENNSGVALVGVVIIGYYLGASLTFVNFFTILTSAATTVSF